MIIQFQEASTEGENRDMPKVYKNKKKFIDPRYFLNETVNRDLEEAVVDPGLTKGGQWPGVDPQKRASDLAQQAMDRQTSGEIPPWEGDGTPDVQLDLLTGEDIAVLESILHHFRRSKYSGGGDRGDRFAEIMAKLGIKLSDHENMSDWSEEDKEHARRAELHRKNWNR